MNSTWSARIRWYSSATGSLTLQTSSACAPDVVGVGEHLRAGSDEVGVRNRRPDSGLTLDDDVMPG